MNDYHKIVKEYEKENVCPFCFDVKRKQIIINDVPKYFMIIANKYPYVENHLLIIPKRHIKKISDFTNPEQIEFMTLVSKYSREMTNELGSCFMFIRQNTEDQSVEHLHYHLLPIQPIFKKNINRVEYKETEFIRRLIGKTTYMRNLSDGVPITLHKRFNKY
jgi:diadenosine tetraphosphate (Ap4A) HIT family hydrolase